ncbi:hypothetical protein LS684_03035 [Cytobacillus spongiae]|jgi:hypothetical protein|nr:hypothetical protein [Cytobacillus spongiae]UII56475.1 hypothetical protein LS684_03035 [Cytobacillus spongiae]
MAEMWVTTFGFVFVLGLSGGVLVYFLKGALDSEDSIRVDPLPEEEDL